MHSSPESDVHSATISRAARVQRVNREHVEARPRTLRKARSSVEANTSSSNSTNSRRSIVPRVTVAQDDTCYSTNFALPPLPASRSPSPVPTPQPLASTRLADAVRAHHNEFTTEIARLRATLLAIEHQITLIQH